MTYPDVVDYLYARLPNAERTGLKMLKPGLANIEALCAGLDHPQRRFRSIHVGGTNGKGSTAHMLAAIYQAAGYRVGLHTSPHLLSLTERVRINGESIPESAVVAFVETNRSLIESVPASFFDVTVAMAFDYFARQSVDLAIIEVGLGGRLDSTNIIVPELSVITNVGLDHTDLLGSTLPAIAGEKAGIIKPDVPVVIGETQEPAVMSVWEQVAQRAGSQLVVADQYTKLKDLGIQDGYRFVECLSPDLRQPGLQTATNIIRLDLLGAYQLRNAATALTAVAQLTHRFPVASGAIMTGLAAVGQTTGFRGRWQILRQQPLVIADTAHNPPGVVAMLVTIAQFSYSRLHIIWGMVGDKDIDAVLGVLPQTAAYYFCQIDSPRSFPVEELQQRAAARGLMGITYRRVDVALADVLDQYATVDDLVLVSGSTYLVADLVKIDV